MKYVSRVKYSNPGKGVAIEKEALGSPSTTVANFTLLVFSHIYMFSIIPI